MKKMIVFLVLIIFSGALHGVGQENSGGSEDLQGLGKIVFITGPMGSGKSTIAQALFFCLNANGVSVAYMERDWCVDTMLVPERVRLWLDGVRASLSSGVLLMIEDWVNRVISDLRSKGAISRELLEEYVALCKGSPLLLDVLCGEENRERFPLRNSCATHIEFENSYPYIFQTLEKHSFSHRNCGALTYANFERKFAEKLNELVKKHDVVICERSGKLGNVYEAPSSRASRRMWRLGLDHKTLLVGLTCSQEECRRRVVDRKKSDPNRVERYHHDHAWSIHTKFGEWRDRECDCEYDTTKLCSDEVAQMIAKEIFKFADASQESAAVRNYEAHYPPGANYAEEDSEWEDNGWSDDKYSELEDNGGDDDYLSCLP